MSALRASVAGACAVAAALAGCGGPADTGARDEPGARAAVSRYFAALGAGDARGACAQMTPESRERLGEVGAEALELHGRSCPATIRRILASPGGPRLRAVSRSARITALEREEGAVRVRVTGVGTPVELVRDGGAWLIRSEPAMEPDAQ